MGIYFAIIIGLLVYSDFLPYVTDNNESFSAFFHARNILQFGLSSTAGLTDEASSGAPAAHPYIYTHGGNFPRIPVLVLMLLGVNTIEQQITILALLVGGVSVYLCYKFFSRIGGELFAFLAVAVLSTDYLLFTQWQVNTFRVWHGFFFFASLLCVQTLTERNRRSMGAVLFLNSIGLFYFEIVFGAFVALFSVIYAAVLHRRQPGLAVWTAVVIALGGLVALGTLLGQSFAHLGIERALEDIRLTFLARNFDAAGGGAESAATRLQFFMKNHIVYWDSAFQPSGFLAIDSLRTALYEGVVRVFTPFLILVMAIVSLPGLLKASALGMGGVLRRRVDAGDGGGRTPQPGNTPARRLLLGILFAVVAGWYVLVRWRLFDPVQISSWQGSIYHPFSGIVLQLLLAGSLLLGLLLMTGQDSEVPGAVNHHILGVTRYILAGSAALVITNAAFPGYVWNGYLFRYAPLPVFTVDVWLALALYILLVLAFQSRRDARRGLGGLHRSGDMQRATINRYRVRQAALSFASIALFGAILVYWINLQVSYFAKLPSTSILFMKQLSGPEFRAASFVSDNYTLPIAYFTGQWAYQDQVIPENAVVVTNDGPRLKISGKFIWFADRETNASYLRPQYYLCRVQSDLNSASRLASLPAGGRLENCSNQPLVRAARVSPAQSERVLVASDPTPFDMWAIVKLDPRIPLLPKDLD